MVISTRPCRRLVVVVAAEILLVHHRTLRILLRVLPRRIAERKALLLLATTPVGVLLHLGILLLLIGEILCRLPLTHHVHRLGQGNYPPSLRGNPTGPRLTSGPVVVVEVVVEAAAVAVAIVDVLEIHSKTSTAPRN